jgi:hypothetical protein
LRPGDVEFVDVLCSMTVWTGGVAAIVALDWRRLTEGQLCRAWLSSTRDTLVFGAFLFGVLYAGPGLLIHFVKTRRSLLGVVLGLLAPIALLVVDVGAQLGAEAAIDWLGL